MYYKREDIIGLVHRVDESTESPCFIQNGLRRDFPFLDRFSFLLCQWDKEVKGNKSLYGMKGGLKIERHTHLYAHTNASVGCLHLKLLMAECEQ